MKIDAGKIQTYETDDRGRISLGTENANKRVTIPVVDVETDHPAEDALAAAYRDAWDSATNHAEKWDEVSHDAWNDLDE